MGVITIVGPELSISSPVICGNKIVIAFLVGADWTESAVEEKSVCSIDLSAGTLDGIEDGSAIAPYAPEKIELYPEPICDSKKWLWIDGSAIAVSGF